MSAGSLRLVSWNVNGLRSIDRSGGFRRFLERSGAFLFAIQEVRAPLEALPRRLLVPKGWHAHVVAAERKGYSGVGLYVRTQPHAMVTELGVPELDCEGRLQIAEIGPLMVANVYFPNGNGKDRDNGRVPFKLAFYRSVFERLQAYRDMGKRVVVMGDFNTAHCEIDLARPAQNRKTSGFLPEERAELDRWLAAGWIDTFRRFEPGPGHYTWWSQRQGVRERNVGWRIDYVLACPSAAEYVQSAFIWSHIRGSDHCPVGVELDPAVLLG